MEDDKYQLFVPARQSDQPAPSPTGGNITIYLQQPSRRPFPWAPVLLTLLLLGAVIFVARLALASYFLHEIGKVDQKITAQYHPVPVHPYYPAGTSAAFPPSNTLRLVGTFNMGHRDYVAQTAADVTVLIPARDCETVDGGPICHYQGRSITRWTGHP